MTWNHLKKCLKSLAIREMQIKTNRRFYLTPIRMAKIKNSSDSTCWQRCEERRTFVHCQWDCNPSGNQPHSSSENWKQSYLKTQLYHSLTYTQKILHHITRTHAALVHSRLIYNSQKQKATPDVPQLKNGYRKCGTFT